MPKKLQQNSKAVAAKEKKAAHQAQVDAEKRAQKDAQEAAEWSKGAKGKSKKDLDAEKKAEAAAKKAEAAALLAAEEAEFKSAKKSPAPVRGAAKQASKRQDRLETTFQQESKATSAHVESFAASNIDDALDLLDSTGGAVSVGKASGAAGSRKDVIDRHPERRAKAAYAAYEERELPVLKKENPGLRLTQLKELLWKQWQKSPENPFNQQGKIAFNASREEEQAAVEALRKQTEDRLKIK